jgi:predicted ArsR family transcriptional regulator
MTPHRPATTYWIIRPEQIAAITSPLRQEVIDRLAALGPMTVKELARTLRRRPTAMYHHLQRLLRVGLLRTVQTPKELGRPAQSYVTVAPRMRLARAARDPRNRASLAKAGVVAARRAGRDYAQGFRRPGWAIEGAARNHWFFRAVATPSRARLKRINSLLDELAEEVWASEGELGPPITVAWFLAPLAGTRDRKERR